MRRFLTDLAKTALAYLLIVAGGTLVSLIAASFVGYLPYSDRPGPGWQGWRGGITLGEIGFYLSWGVFLLVPGIVVGILLFLGTQFLQWLRTPKWLVAVIGALGSGFLSMYIVLGAGWYIAIGAIPVFGAGVLGIAFGGLLLPGMAGQAATSAGLSLMYRLAIMIVVCIAIAGGIVERYNAASCQRDPNLNFTFVKWTPGPAPLTVRGLTLSPDVLAVLKSRGYSGDFYVNMFHSGGGQGKSARVVIVLSRPIDAPVELPQPDGGMVIYVFDAGRWQTIPPDPPRLRRTIRLSAAEQNPARIHFESKGSCWGPNGDVVFDWATSPKGESK